MSIYYTKKDQLNLDFDDKYVTSNNSKNNHVEISNVVSFLEMRTSVKKKKDAKLFDRIISLSNHLY